MKAFKVTGEIHKPNLATPFAKEIIADKSEHAVEKVYAEIGSKHRVKRFHIKIANVQEMNPDEIENPILKKLVTGE
jgi:large subunit ribosomal protein LX